MTQYNTSKLLVFDVESLGLNPEKHSIASFGACVWNRNTGNVEDQIELFIKEEPLVWVEAALKVNKIDLNWLKEHGKTPEDAMSELKVFLVKNFGQPTKENLITLCAYNLKFDDLFFQRFCYLAKLHESAYNGRFAYPKICALEFIKFYNIVFDLRLENCKFATVLKHFNITRTGVEHSALSDAQNLVQLLNKFRESFKLDIS